MCLYNIQNSRYRNRDHAVLASDKAASLAETRHDNFIRRQIINADSSSDDIHDGIDGSDLMEMHLIERHAVGFCLCFREDLENALRQRSCSRCQIAAADNRKNLRQPAVLMMVMMLPCVIVVMAVRMLVVMWMVMHFRPIPVQIRHIVIMVLMLCIQNHIEIAGIQPRLFHSCNRNFVSRQFQAFQ